MGTKRVRAVAVGAAVVMATAGAALVPLVSQAAEPKSHTVAATPSVAAGAQAPMVVSVTNTSTSGNITAQGVRAYVDPALASSISQVVVSRGRLATTPNASKPYFEVLSAGMRPGQTLTISFTAAISCAAWNPDPLTQYEWRTDVRQSNDFQGTNNKIPLDSVAGGVYPRTSVTSGCGLAFTTQPTDTAPGDTMAAVSVAAVSGGPNPTPVAAFNGLVTLSIAPNVAVGGSLSASAVGGVATFQGLSIDSIGRYRFTAASAGFDPMTSVEFEIGYGLLADCVRGTEDDCRVDVVGDGTSATITVNENDGLNAFLTAGLTDDIACPGFAYSYGSTIVFDIRVLSGSVEGDYTKSVTVTKDAVYGSPGDADFELWKYQVCFEADYAFPTIPFFPTAQQNYEWTLQFLTNPVLPLAEETSPGSGVYRGLLPSCLLVGYEPSSGTMDGEAPTPCVATRTFADGTVTTVGVVPAADPNWR